METFLRNPQGSQFGAGKQREQFFRITALMAVFFAFPYAMIGNRIAVASIEKFLLYKNIGFLKVNLPNCLYLLLAYWISSFFRTEGMSDSMCFEMTRGNCSSRAAFWINAFVCRIYSTESRFSSMACVFVGFSLFWTVFICAPAFRWLRSPPYEYMFKKVRGSACHLTRKGRCGTP